MGLIGHRVSTGLPFQPEFPPAPSGLFDYVIGCDGVYVHGKREGLEVNLRVAPHNIQIRGLAHCWELFKFTLPKVPFILADEIFRRSKKFADEHLETLFHLVYSPVYPYHDGWELVEPEQERTETKCKPLDDGPGSSHAKAIIEIHSHHSMPARFSPTDDKDEQGFRIYGVIGRLDTEPEIRMRVGVYGYFWEIPADYVMELPDGLKDCVEDSCYELGEYTGV